MIHKNTPVFWTMKDGSKINVDDMDQNHLRNTLKMVLKNIEHAKREVKLETKHKACNISSNFVEEEIQEIQNEMEEYYLDWDDIH